MQLVLCQSVNLQQVSNLELRQTLKQKIRQALTTARIEIGLDKSGTYDKVVQTIINDHCPEHLKPILGTILLDEAFKKNILGNMDEYVHARLEDAQEIAAGYLFDASKGKIEDGANSYNLDRPIFREALLDRQALEKRIKEYESLKSLGKDFTTEAAKILTQCLGARQFSISFAESFAALSNGVYAALQIRGYNDRKILPDFFLDAIILDRFTWMLPERFTRRFVKRFKVIRARDTFRSSWARDAFLNTIGEFTLLTLGIISPEMFTLRRGSIDQEVVDDFKEIGIDLKASLQRTNIHSSGTFFWNRWQTLNRKPTTVIDNLIRDFLCRTVRKDADSILEAIKFEALFDRLKEAAQNSDLDEEDQREACAEVLIEAIIDDRFMATLTDQLKHSWLKELEIFY